MNPEKNQNVKLYFRNTTQVEGIVELWSDTKVVLKDPLTNNILIITDISKDLMMVKIVHYQSPSHEKLEKKVTETIQQFEEVKKEPSSDLRMQKLADLKKMMIRQDKLIVTDKLKQHISTNKEVKYGIIPGLFKKSSYK